MWRRRKWWWEFLETWRWVRGWSHKIKVTAFFFSTVSIAGIEDGARELMPSWKAQCPYTSLLSPGIKRRREIWKFCLLAQTIGVYAEQLVLVLLPGIFHGVHVGISSQQWRKRERINICIWSNSKGNIDRLPGAAMAGASNLLPEIKTFKLGGSASVLTTSHSWFSWPGCHVMNNRKSCCSRAITEFLLSAHTRGFPQWVGL